MIRHTSATRDEGLTMRFRNSLIGKGEGEPAVGIEPTTASLDGTSFYPYLPTRHEDSCCHIRGNSPNTPQNPSRTLPQTRHTAAPGRSSGSRAFQQSEHQPAIAKKANCHQGKPNGANGLGDTGVGRKTNEVGEFGRSSRRHERRRQAVSGAP